MSANYQAQLNTHLAKYKRGALGISEPGYWTNPRTAKKLPYDHILPDGSRNKNILSPYRERFWNDFATWAEQEPQHVIKLHKYFQHLNSSQALCFNLFYPLIADHAWSLIFLKDVLGLADELPKRQWFEWVEDPA